MHREEHICGLIKLKYDGMMNNINKSFFLFLIDYFFKGLRPGQ